MIKYKLICKNCNLTFESWFSSSKNYEKLKAKKLINCYNCKSLKVEKTLMAPQLISKKTNNLQKGDLKKLNEAHKTLKKYQKFIKNNFQYVGNNFAYKARSIHYSNKNYEKGIYGRATSNEIKELKDEGIETQIVPWVNDKNN